MSELQPYPELEDKIRMAMRAPEADAVFVQELRSQLMAKSTKAIRPRSMFRPAWALVLVLFVALAILMIGMPSVAAAIGRIFGYVPDVGLVENTGDLRMLAAPVSIEREGITLRITNVLVYADRIELTYEVSGIGPDNDGQQAADASTNPTAFCGGVNIGDAPKKDGDALLALPDGSILERDYTGLYPKNAYAMTPVYSVALPADVSEMTMVLRCIPWARLGAVPENWVIPFQLVPVPAGTVVGEPVHNVQQPTAMPTTASPTATATVPAAQVPPPPEVKLTFDKVVLAEPRSYFYFSLDTVQPPDPSLIAIMPADVYVIDSLGQKIQLVPTDPMYPVQHPVGSLFQFFSTSKPADGPLTLVVENAVAHYAPLYVEPRQATPEEMTFSFDAGAAPQPGQTWPLDHSIEVVGYKLRFTSVRAVTLSDVPGTPSESDSQGYNHGYQFAIESDPSVKISAFLDVISLSPPCWPRFGAPDVPESSSLLYTQFCRNEYPKGSVSVVFEELYVLVENTWQVTGTPQ